MGFDPERIPQEARRGHLNESPGFGAFFMFTSKERLPARCSGQGELRWITMAERNPAYSIGLKRMILVFFLDT